MCPFLLAIDLVREFDCLALKCIYIFFISVRFWGLSYYFQRYCGSTIHDIISISAAVPTSHLDRLFIRGTQSISAYLQALI